MEKFLTVKEASKILEVSVSSLYFWGKKGLINIVKKNKKLCVCEEQIYSIKKELDKERELKSKNLKECTICKAIKDIKDFRYRICRKCIYSEYSKIYYKNNKERLMKIASEYRKKNIDSFNEKKRIWTKNNPEKVKRSVIKKTYHITYEQYNDMLIKCNNRCEICNKEYDRPNVDHDHKTGKIRGILCGNCNCGMGSLKDDINIITSAINYLKIKPRYTERYKVKDPKNKQIIKDNNTTCEICKGTKKIFVDHDHNTGLIRGVLCSTCNFGIGLLSEDIEIMENAINYLKDK